MEVTSNCGTGVGHLRWVFLEHMIVEFSPGRPSLRLIEVQLDCVIELIVRVLRASKFGMEHSLESEKLRLLRSREVHEVGVVDDI